MRVDPLSVLSFVLWSKMFCGLMSACANALAHLGGGIQAPRMQCSMAGKVGVAYMDKLDFFQRNERVEQLLGECPHESARKWLAVMRLLQLVQIGPIQRHCECHMAL
jgi:hypothetical protein